MAGPPPARPAPRLASDDGFTLVEAVVALFVLGIVFTALTAASIGAMRASLVARVEQQGVDFATQGLEKARQADFWSLAHVTSDLAGDPRVTTCGSNKCFDPGTGAPEVLFTAASGGIATHVTQVPISQSNKVPIQVSTYVTDPGDTDAAYRRVTVVATWSVAGKQRERRVSGLITESSRGLPLPIFKLVPIGSTSATVNPDVHVPFALELSNQGAPDRWNLTFTGSAAATWSLHRDDGDGIWEPTQDDELTNTNSPDDGLLDTGRIDPTGSVVFWAVRDVAGSTAPGDYWTTLTATSAAQPTAVTGAASVDLLVRVLPEGTAGTGDPGGGQVSTVPGAPTNLQAATGNTQLTLSWQAPASAGSSEITDYVITYKQTGTAAWLTFSDGVSTATTATITGLVNDTTYDVAVAAKNSAGVGAQATAQGEPEPPMTYVPPVTCPASALAASAATHYSLRTYWLHNRSAANPSWPGAGTPAATSTIGQGLPLVAANDGSSQVPAGTDLPVYSSDILGTERGRVVVNGGSLTTTDTTRVVDWRATVGSKAYKGDAVLVLWVAPVTGDDAALPWSVTAQPYYRRSDGTLVSLASASTVNGAANSFGVGGTCGGWKQVYFRWSVNQSSALGANEYAGVRVWVPTASGRMARLRLGYDVVGDFPAGLTLPEKP